jgi:GDP-L-fucose synthase
MKSILLTGSSGFIGKNLSELLKKENIDVFSPSSKDFNLTKEKDVDRLYKQRDFNCVLHLAADVGGIKMIKANQGRIFYNNIMMNTLLMEKARVNKIKKFISLNTINCYPENDGILNENQIWNGFPNKETYSYGISKRMSIVQSLAYNDQYNFDSINLILDNTYGPHDNFDIENSRVIPALIQKFYEAVQNNKPSVEVWGTGKSIRQFLYVGDLVKIIKLFIDNDIKNCILNISNGQKVSIRDLVENIASILEFQGNIIYNSRKPEGAPVRLMDNLKMKETINYSDFELINSGLKKTIEWYVSNLRKG